MALERIERSTHQRIHDEVIEARGDQHKAQIARQQLSLDYLRQIIGHKSVLTMTEFGL
jgi:hypothetical protein